MKKLSNSKLVYTPAFLLTAIFSSVFWTSNIQAAAEEPVSRILVNGQGTASVAPDMAILSLTVTREAKTAQAALKEGSKAMADVLAAMQSAGVAKRDLRTSGFSIQPRYTHPTSKSSSEMSEPRIVGYTVRNALTVKVREIEDVGMILDKSVSLGVNEGGNISFSNEDPSGSIKQARIQAMKDAASKAETLARTAGVNIGKILEISEQSYYPSPAPMARMSAAEGFASKAVPVAAGENTYSVSVSVSYAIDQ